MTSDEIKKIIHELLMRMNIAVERIDVSEADGRERFAVKSSDSHLLIGTKGAHLFALNHLVKKIAAKTDAAEKALPNRAPGQHLPGGAERERQFQIDVNDYQTTAAENLKNLAAIMGGRARSFKANVELEPMSSYERMIIHSFFQDAPDIKTESIGEGERRRVVIRYTGDL